MDGFIKAETPKAPLRYLDVICEEIITVVRESAVAVLENVLLYLYYILHLKKAAADGIKVRTCERFLRDTAGRLGDKRLHPGTIEN